MKNFETGADKKAEAYKKVEEYCKKFDQVIITDIMNGFLALRINKKGQPEGIYAFNNAGEMQRFDAFGYGPEAEKEYEMMKKRPKAKVYQRGKLIQILD